MAPELALEKLKGSQPGAVILDPMAGSGTVVRQASDLGHRAIGLDTDPLAVLISKVWTTSVNDDLLGRLADRVCELAASPTIIGMALPWIDDDPPTIEFINRWFAEPQQSELRRLSCAIAQASTEFPDPSTRDALDVLRVALSRIIITKDKGASLARDVSHSRPHKAWDTTDFAVRPAFQKSVQTLQRRLNEEPPGRGVKISLGDARCLNGIGSGSIDAVLTSPPYLNAIDYMRGHRMSLVWLGYRVSDLRSIRSNNVGTERAAERASVSSEVEAMRGAIGDVERLPKRLNQIVHRYTQDIWCVLGEIRRVLADTGQATFVIGNSCIRDIFIRNADALACGAYHAGLRLLDRTERPLPTRNRYLPMTSEALGKRMRTETVMSFAVF